MCWLASAVAMLFCPPHLLQDLPFGSDYDDDYYDDEDDDDWQVNHRHAWSWCVYWHCMHREYVERNVAFCGVLRDGSNSSAAHGQDALQLLPQPANFVPGCKAALHCIL
jgi:hypothetical protein